MGFVSRAPRALDPTNALELPVSWPAIHDELTRLPDGFGVPHINPVSMTICLGRICQGRFSLEKGRLYDFFRRPRNCNDRPDAMQSFCPVSSRMNVSPAHSRAMRAARFLAVASSVEGVTSRWGAAPVPLRGRPAMWRMQEANMANVGHPLFIAICSDQSMGHPLCVTKSSGNR